MDGFSEKKWFVYMGDHHEGPFSLEEIRAKLRSAEVATASYVWCEGMADWKMMTEVSAFAAILPGSRTGLTPIPGGLSTPVSATSAAAASPVLEATPTSDAAPVFETSSISAQLNTVNAVSPEVAAAMSSPMREAPAIVISAAAATDAAQMHHAAAAAAGPQRSLGPQPLGGPQPVAAAPLPPEKAAKRGGGLIRLVLVLLILAAPPVALISGLLDPALDSPAVKPYVDQVAEAMRPMLLELSEKVPVLQEIISPIPRLDDVAADDYEVLKSAAKAPVTEGIRVELALVGKESARPVFQVATNLPDDSRIEVTIEGVPETLLNTTSFNGKQDLAVKGKLARSQPFQGADGQQLPRGLYLVKARNPAQSSPGFNRKLFLGGERDAAYSARLKEYHDKLQQMATNEITELTQLAVTLESQFLQSTGKLQALRKGPKPSRAQLKAWGAFHANWAKMDGQLAQSWAKWTPEAVAKDFFYDSLHTLANQAGQAVSAAHQAHDAWFSGAADPKTYDALLNDANARAKAAVDALKERLTRARALTPTPNGMPRKEGL